MGIDGGVVLSQPPSPIQFEGARHCCGPALGMTLRYELIEKFHDVVWQSDSDLRGHTKTVPAWDEQTMS
jgi:hypothetical protein